MSATVELSDVEVTGTDVRGALSKTLVPDTLAGEVPTRVLTPTIRATMKTAQKVNSTLLRPLRTTTGVVD